MTSLHDTLCRLTGYTPGQTSRGAIANRRTLDSGAFVEDLVLEAGSLPATLIRPARGTRHPAVLYCHAHGGEYSLGRREMMDGSRFLQEPAYGPALANLGFAALCIDMPGFGARRSEGSESALSKAYLWRGGCLFGRMLADLGRATGYLAQRPDIDADRLFTLGLSMGGAHAYWLAALDPRIAGTVHMCMLADIGPLISTGAHDRHGDYLTVPGLLGHADTGDVAAGIAPNPQLACFGGADPLTPPAARDPALARTRAAYAETPEAFHSLIDPGAGHGESAAMRVAALDFLQEAAGRPTHFFADEKDP